MSENYFAFVMSNIAHDGNSRFESAVRSFVPRGMKKNWSIMPLLVNAEYISYYDRPEPRKFIEITGRGDMTWTKDAAFFRIDHGTIADMVNMRFLFSGTDTLRPIVFKLSDPGRFVELANILLQVRPEILTTGSVTLARGQQNRYIRTLLGLSNHTVDATIDEICVSPTAKAKLERAVAECHREATAHYNELHERYAEPLKQEFLGLIDWLVK